MILNRSSQYTLQALIHMLAHPAGHPILARDLAEALHLPPHYLAKLLQKPCRVGWLQSLRGRGGGFALSPGTGKVTLLEVLTLTEGERINRECLLGLKDCDDKTACVLHCQWKPIKQAFLGQFGGYTLTQLAASHKHLPAWLSEKQAPPGIRTRRTPAPTPR